MNPFTLQQQESVGSSKMEEVAQQNQDSGLVILLKDVSLKPQVRHILRQMLQNLEEHQQPKDRKQQAEITRDNTTLIGDYIVAGFPQWDAKWLVQATGNTTFESVLADIISGKIIVDRKYVFILLGHNQIRTSTKSSIKWSIFNCIEQIRIINAQSRIFFVSLLPRPVDNQVTKLLITKFNRALAGSVNVASKQFKRVRFVAVQHEFVHNSIPLDKLYNQDKFTLSLAGLALLKNKVLLGAGFVKNQ